MQTIIRVYSGVASKQVSLFNSFRELFPKSGVRISSCSDLEFDNPNNQDTDMYVVALRSIDKEIKSLVLGDPKSESEALFLARYKTAVVRLNTIYDRVLTEPIREFTFFDMDYLESNPEQSLELLKEALGLDLEKNRLFSADSVNSKNLMDLSQRAGRGRSVGYNPSLIQTSEDLEEINLSEIYSSYENDLESLQIKYNSIVEKAKSRVVLPKN